MAATIDVWHLPLQDVYNLHAVYCAARESEVSHLRCEVEDRRVRQESPEGVRLS